MPPGLIAIVDDDNAVRVALVSLVRSLGYTVTAFSSAEAFLKYEQINGTSCVVTDVQMPGLSGVDLQDRRSLWVIASRSFFSPAILMKTCGCGP